jgi:hypothetical protein
MGELRENLLGGDEGGHRLLGWAIAHHQILMKAQRLLRGKPSTSVRSAPTDSSAIARETPTL